MPWYTPSPMSQRLEFIQAVLRRKAPQSIKDVASQYGVSEKTAHKWLTRFDGEPVGDWHLDTRDRVQRLYVDALMELGTRLVKEERHGKAAEVYRRVLARDELHEEALVALMQCHAAAGERAQALRAYTRFASRMHEELDAKPGTEAAGWYRKIQEAV